MAGDTDLLVEIRDLLYEQNKLMSQVVQMNQKAMEEGAVRAAQSMAYAANAELVLAKARRQNGLLLWATLAFLALALVLLWNGPGSTLRALGL